MNDRRRGCPYELTLCLPSGLQVDHDSVECPSRRNALLSELGVIGYLYELQSDSRICGEDVVHGLSASH